MCVCLHRTQYPMSHSNTGVPRRKFHSLPVWKLWAACHLVLQMCWMRCLLPMVSCQCQNINNSMYDRLGESPSKARVWKCLACDNLNITTNSLRSLDSYETSNPYEPLDTSNHSNISFSRIQTSTPKSKQQHSSSKNPFTKQKNKNNKISKSSCCTLSFRCWQKEESMKIWYTPSLSPG